MILAFALYRCFNEPFYFFGNLWGLVGAPEGPAQTPTRSFQPDFIISLHNYHLFKKQLFFI